MGVPAFYRWLTSKYPKVVLNNIENNNNNSDSISNSTLISEYDNLYIDMNGLIHPCAHPDDHPAPKNELEIYENIVKYVDRLFEAIKPKRLLFLSIDGVAPRAKMNQQRARRYRAAQEKIQRDELTSQVLNEMFPDVQLPEQTIWDSNVITPGTEFMSKLSDYLHEYIENKMKTDKEWKNIKVIFSDASVCGEGEHKIMAFIRSQRSQEGYDPNQHHVVHGLDADLIMLALATHEPKFSILREEQTPQYGRKKDKKQKQNRESIDDRNPVDWIHMKKLLCLRIEYLREYLSQEFAYLQDVLTHKYDLERIIDDFIFLCYFVGNDFLPHLPTLEIREGGIDLLLEAYKQLIQNWDDYITGIDENGLRVIHTTQLADILRKVSENETEILVQQESEARKLEDLAAQSAGTSGFTKNHKHNNNNNNNNRRPNRQQDPKDNEIADDNDGNDNNGEDEEEQEENNDETEITDDGTNEILKIVKEEVDRRLAEIDRNAALEQRRHLRGHIHGDTPQERYYNNPFRLKDLQDGGSLERMCDSYLDGLCWVLNYYFQGPPSWGWYYPFHYAPCASDLFRNVTNRLSNQSTITYATDHSFPLKPVEQLLCVLPAESASALPLACRGLMTSKTASPLSDIYHPKDILIDRGNEMSWLWIILLPFIDVNRIIKSAKECEPHFTDEETHRNSYGSAYLYIHSSQCIDTSSHHTSPESVEESAKTEKDDLKNCLIENSSKSIYPLFGFVSSQPIEVNNDHNHNNHHNHNHHEDSNVVIFQYFLPNESIHRSSLIDGILPLTSPLDLRFNRKKNRGGGRGWGNGRGKGRRRGGRGGNRKGRGESQDDNQNNDRDDDNNDDEADAVVENAEEETFHHGKRDHNHNHENEHKHYDHDHSHSHDHQHDHHHHH